MQHNTRSALDDKGSSLLDEDELLEEDELDDKVEDEDEDDWEIVLFRDIFLGAGLLLPGPLRPVFVSMPWNNDIWSGDSRCVFRRSQELSAGKLGEGSSLSMGINVRSTELLSSSISDSSGTSSFYGPHSLDGDGRFSSHHTQMHTLCNRRVLDRQHNAILRGGPVHTLAPLATCSPSLCIDTASLGTEFCEGR